MKKILLCIAVCLTAYGVGVVGIAEAKKHAETQIGVKFHNTIHKPVVLKHWSKRVFPGSTWEQKNVRTLAQGASCKLFKDFVPGLLGMQHEIRVYDKASDELMYTIKSEDMQGDVTIELDQSEYRVRQ